MKHTNKGSKTTACVNKPTTTKWLPMSFLIKEFTNLLINYPLLSLNINKTLAPLVGSAGESEFFLPYHPS